jgi:RNA-directed DNA polymerase
LPTGDCSIGYRLDSKSRMSGDVHVRICESLGVRFPWATRLVITGISQEVLEEEVNPLVVDFLRERGLELSQEKTTITHIEDGFDFLGQNVRKYNGIFLMHPSKKNVKTFLTQIRKAIRENKQATAYWLIATLNPKIRGWANYHQHANAKKTFVQVDTAIFNNTPPKG